jgi:hypothetical protein
VLRGIRLARPNNNGQRTPTDRDEKAGHRARLLQIQFREQRHMARLSFTASVLASFLRSAVNSLLTFLGPSWDGPVRRYRPEDHYMRGPGPKWREKHDLDRAAAGSI